MDEVEEIPMKGVIFNGKQFIIITLLTSIWIHITEILRAVFVAFPLMKDFFGDRIPIGPMGFSNALIWGAWDMILTATLVFITWLCMLVFGKNIKTILISATVTTFATMGVFWIASVNTGLGVWSTAFTIIPIVWIEMIIAAWIVIKLYSRKGE